MMKPFTVNGDLWRVVRVTPGSPPLIDRTGEYRIATTDPETRELYISNDLKPPMLDRVLLHEVAHAVAVSYDLIGGLKEIAPEESWDAIEEWAVQMVENHGIEAAEAASASLGRPICVGGRCHD